MSVSRSDDAALQYWAGDGVPPFGQPQTLEPGVHWLRMPLPLALDHINLWLLDDGDGWVLVDCGLNDEPTRALWTQLLGTSWGGRPLTRVICTHMHPDHVGMADWHCTRSGATLLMTQGEYLSARLISAGMAPTDTASNIEHYRHHGAPAETLRQMEGRGNFYARMVPSVPLHYQRIADGDVLRIGDDDWQVIRGGGHSPEHASLWSARRGLLISGDLLLPRISTNVSVFPVEPLADSLGAYLRSLERFAELPAEARVLPSHGRPFRGITPRLHQLREHHAHRLGDVLHACLDGERTATELLPVLFRRQLDVHQLGFALGESIAHLNRLWAAGLLERRVGADGVVRFAAVAGLDRAPGALEQRARAAAGL